MTTAQHGGHRLPNLSIRRLRVLIQECFGCHNDAVNTKSALHGLLVDERFLNWMGFLDRPEPLECGDFRSRYGSHGCDARANCLTFNNHRARSALTETTPKLRSTECKIVAEHIEQMSLGVHIQRMAPAINLQNSKTYSTPSYPGGQWPRGHVLEILESKR